MIDQTKVVWSRRQILWLTGWLLLTLLAAQAERLPVKTYTTADGLPRDNVLNIKLDARGFLWVFTGDGFSIFDGHSFINHTTDDGLPDRRVNDFLETREGAYWLATSRGLCRFNPRGDRLRSANFGTPVSAPSRPSGPLQLTTPTSATPNSDAPMFVVYNPADAEKPVAFNVLWETDGGVIWCGTDRGLYRMTEKGGQVHFEFVDLGRLTANKFEGAVTAIVKDRRGALWIASDKSGLYRLLPDGRAERYTTEQGLPDNQIASLFEDRDGQIWVGARAHSGGLYRLVSEPDPRRLVVARLYTKKDGLPAEWISSLYQTRDGRLWVGTAAGLCLFVPSAGAGEPSFQVYSAQNGLCNEEIWRLMEDRDGNLWVASQCSLMKVARNGFTTYGAADGLDNPYVNSIFENRDGELVVINSSVREHGRAISHFDGQRFIVVEPNLPPYVMYHGWGWGQTIIQDHTGEWWVPTGKDGLFRFPRVNQFEQLASVNPKAVYSRRDGLSGKEVFRLYEDRRGDVWIATTGITGLMRWERSTGVFHDLTQETGVPPQTDFTAFREDAQGNLWIGTAEGGGLLRYRDGKFKRFTTEDGAPPGWVIWLYLDHAGKLWIASQLGDLNRIDDPAADALRVVRYTTLDGLSSNNIRSITEDGQGRIYAGTGHGVDRLDPESGQVKQYTVADGLPKGGIETSYRDRHGALWFGSLFGLARFIPETEEAHLPPSVYLNGLRIEGAPQRISELGESDLRPLELSAGQNHLSIDFVGLSPGLGDELRYQYRLEGADQDWSSATTQHTVNYANLSPGRYRFAVRAIGADGSISPAPASLSFTILTPVWMRWWFITLVALAFLLLGYVLYRYRVASLLEVAKMRTRIATDLHDDIGSGLSRVAILSEVVKQQIGDTTRQSVPLLTEIAESARVLVASMRDIVWAIDPRQDDLSNVVFRVRRFASDVLEPQGIRLDFQVPSDLEKIKLDPEQRQHLFLIFKEAINNIARHAGCRLVSLGMTVSHNQMTVIISDDGCGFSVAQPQAAPANEHIGHGLENMRSRAEELGGCLNVDSSPGLGTSLTLTFPLKKR